MILPIHLPDGMLSSEVRTGENAYTKAYTYDARGNCSEISANDGITTYSYDANNRMTEKTEWVVGEFTGTSSDYYYDGNGNLVTEVKGSVSNILNSLNEFKAEVTMNVGGDLGYELKTYAYDLYNRMTDFESAEHTAHYTYNPDGMRRSKAVDGNPVITHIWNGSEIVAEVGGAVPTIQNTYVYGLDRIMTGDGEYFTYNSHGDTTGFDGDEYDYDAFGNQIDENADATYNPFRYCGEYFDEELLSLYEQ